MKPQEVIDLSAKEREEKVKDLQEEIFNLKFQHATGKIENPARLRLMRRDIARIKTIQKVLKQKSQDQPAVKEKQETAADK